jgi:uncharacterized protein
MQTIVAFFVGLLFGVGLIVAGMTDPGKVQGFLDLAGAWDPSLALVMGGAVLVGLAGFALASRRERALLGGAMKLPSSRVVDRRLLGGSLLFGVGWGLGGYCPGPAVASLALGGKPVIFAVAMVAGMALFEVLERRPRSRAQKA